MLAAPVLALSFCGCYAYLSTDWMRALSLGFGAGALSSIALSPSPVLAGKDDNNLSLMTCKCMIPVRLGNSEPVRHDAAQQCAMCM